MSEFNVIDKYRGWELDLIKKDYSKSLKPFACLVENWQADYNVSGIIRNANVFAANEVFYLKGKKKFDPRGTVGTHKYTLVNWLDSYDKVASLKDKYYLVAIDNCQSNLPTYSIQDYVWEPNTLMVFGEEGVGLTQAMLALCEEMVYIPQYGTVRSMNAACASAVCMASYVNQYR